MGAGTKHGLSCGKRHLDIGRPGEHWPAMDYVIGEEARRVGANLLLELDGLER